MYPNQPQTSSSMAIGPQTSQARSLRNDQACTRSDRACVPLGRYVAAEHEYRSVAVGVENGYDKVNVQTSAKMSVSIILRQLCFVKNVTTKDLALKPCSSLGWIRHRLSQGNGYVSKTATDKFEYNDRNTDKPSTVATQQPSMHTARSLRSDRARAKHAHGSVAT
ncbi:hypothetical protein IGI04_039769 [Brassica rapa subsp. trilocularis]|uniref:Uncharacterized protein n=1 Tax=Brassica rapa subsp. trilocularis TaxID=1813537 RepID=A0ABQ7KKT9_BRACM|nr:hypothetical protein IGI04_039769 [Brassica rapa subsp. trilocularis]